DVTQCNFWKEMGFGSPLPQVGIKDRTLAFRIAALGRIKGPSHERSDLAITSSSFRQTVFPFSVVDLVQTILFQQFLCRERATSQSVGIEGELTIPNESIRNLANLVESSGRTRRQPQVTICRPPQRSAGYPAGITLSGSALCLLD